MAQALRNQAGQSIEDLLASGDECWSQGDRPRAHDLFRAAQQVDGNDPRVLSRLGLSLTLVARDEYKGVAFCEEALRRGGEDVEALYRLALVYQATFQKERAVRAVRRGLELDNGHEGLVSLIHVLGVRRPPIFPFLKRSNPLNKYLGMLRHRYLRAKERE